MNDSSVINELNKNKIIEEVLTLPEAIDKAKDFWASARHEELSKNEKGIIKMIDTLTNAPVFKKFTNKSKLGTANEPSTGIGLYLCKKIIRFCVKDQTPNHYQKPLKLILFLLNLPPNQQVQQGSKRSALLLAFFIFFSLSCFRTA